MVGVIFAICISVGLPLFAFIYACRKRRYIPFLLGVIAFVGSQIFFRIPIMQYLEGNSTSYLMFSVMRPILFSVLIGLSAGIVEGLARFIMIRFFMKQRDWKSGFLFGAGHGGVEAILFVGIQASVLLFSPSVFAYSTDFIIGGIERFFAILLHIGLSLIVLQGVVQKKFLYVILAILIHGIVDSLIGILPLLLPANYVIISLETSLAITALAVFSYSISLNRKGVLQ